jgi:hypothetical protein
MINGKDHDHRRNGIALNGFAENASAESSEFYGDYERKLAHELTELLRSMPPDARAERRKLLGDAGHDAAPAALAGPATGHEEDSLQRSAPPFVAAARPYNDFVDDGSDPPIPSTWLAEAEPESDSIGRNLKFGAAGLCAGLALAVPVVLALTGRLDGLAGVNGRAPAAIASSAAPPLVDFKPAPVAALTHPSPVTAESRAAPERGSLTASTSQPAVQVADTAPPPPLQSAAVTVREQAAPVVQTLTERPVDPPPPDPIAELMASGLRLIGAGDIGAAREAFSRAASTGDAAATMALAETFDPNMLAAWGARDVKADVGTARMLYGKALDAGITKARMRLEALN